MGTEHISLEAISILSKIPIYSVLFTVIPLFIGWQFLKRRITPENESSESDFDQKLKDWRPDQLVPDIPDDHPALKPMTVSSRIGKYITIDGNECLNLATHNYLGLVGSKDIENEAIQTIKNYGVGSCGPRGFYGTLDVHLELEKRIAEFMDMEEAVVYSYGFSTISSAIAAYCKRKDMVFVDEKVNFSIQKGLDASRSNIKYFKHNDVKDLERLLLQEKGLNKKNSNNVEKTRKFLIVEGIYMNTGKICPLPELVALCRKYKLRIFVDESISFGTLGAHGKGVTEHFNVPRHEIDMIMGSLEWAMGSIGGFCVGSSFVIEHHRLSGLGYCFSASLPPLLTTVATKALDIMEEDDELFKTLRENCSTAHCAIKKSKYFECFSDMKSPVKHLVLKMLFKHNEGALLLGEISKKCIEQKIAIITPAYLDSEREQPTPSLRLCISSVLTSSDIEKALNILEKVASEVLM
ncbi:serine palmitoyltransferase 1 [Trichogramma pretiosum]|uniref:serine palmitoyltransferase 1 n=1 Tax=Trichogramma pretiosum TaxID=7493 RepID=UPI0006C9AF3B|nr:serine palmitoyltransferase 1 [Trichogramma pretiosum]